jgi:hypothetical protein
MRGDRPEKARNQVRAADLIARAVYVPWMAHMVHGWAAGGALLHPKTNALGDRRYQASFGQGTGPAAICTHHRY